MFNITGAVIDQSPPPEFNDRNQQTDKNLAMCTYIFYLRSFTYLLFSKTKPFTSVVNSDRQRQLAW